MHATRLPAMRRRSIGYSATASRKYNVLDEVPPAMVMPVIDWLHALSEKKRPDPFPLKATARSLETGASVDTRYAAQAFTFAEFAP